MGTTGKYRARPVVLFRSDKMTEASEHVFKDCGSWWFETEDESSIGPFQTVDAADDAFKAYCAEVLVDKKPDAALEKAAP